MFRPKSSLTGRRETRRSVDSHGLLCVWLFCPCRAVWAGAAASAERRLAEASAALVTGVDAREVGIPDAWAKSVLICSRKLCALASRVRMLPIRSNLGGASQQSLPAFARFIDFERSTFTLY